MRCRPDHQELVRAGRDRADGLFGRHTADHDSKGIQQLPRKAEARGINRGVGRGANAMGPHHQVTGVVGGDKGCRARTRSRPG